MLSFVALFRGSTLDSAKFVGSTLNADLIKAVTACLLAEEGSQTGDAAYDAITRGRKQALRIIRKEVAHN